MSARPKDAYAAAGVNIDAGHETVRRIRALVRATRTPGVLADIGAFGGLFRLPAGLRRPVLVASTDGVGTKILVAAAAGRFDTIGQDLVNHCVNDILVQGARPLFFLDYFATGQLRPAMAAQVVAGLARACRANGCALLGGETAEMPGLYRGRDFDLAGTIVGVVEQDRIINGERIRPGDVILGLPSSGLHTNGYSLARRIVFQSLKLKPTSYVPELGCTVAEELLKGHRSYLPVLGPLLTRVKIHGLAHITGGGFLDNIPRILPPRCRAVIHRGTWPMLPVFSWLRERGRLPEHTFYRTFNAGIGMIVVVGSADAHRCRRWLQSRREPAYALGEIESGPASVRLA